MLRREVYKAEMLPLTELLRAGPGSVDCLCGDEGEVPSYQEVKLRRSLHRWAMACLVRVLVRGSNHPRIKAR
jgi:hypothetical protein